MLLLRLVEGCVQRRSIEGCSLLFPMMDAAEQDVSLVEGPGVMWT